MYLGYSVLSLVQCEIICSNGNQVATSPKIMQHFKMAPGSYRMCALARGRLFLCYCGQPNMGTVVVTIVHKPYHKTPLPGTIMDNETLLFYS